MEPSFTEDQIYQISNLSEEERIGNGGNGVVYRGVHDGKRVAVKVYDANATAKAQEQAQTEIQSYSCFNNNNIIRRLGHANSESKTYLVLEYMPKTLQTRILEKGVAALSWDDAYHILKQLVDVLVYIKTQSCVLIDLKPTDILVDERDTIKLCDFGLVIKDGQYCKGSNNGYAAPETYGKEKCTHKADVFSFGVIILQVLMKEGGVGNLRDRRITYGNYKNYNRCGRKAKGEDVKNLYAAMHITSKAWDKEHIVHDSYLKSGCSLANAKAITRIAGDCTNDKAGKRPDIDQVQKMIRELKEKKVEGPEKGKNKGKHRR